MELHIKQAQIAKDNHRFRVICCGRRFGKTTLAIEEIKGKAYAKECRIAYIAPTYQQARDIAWELLKKELRPIIIQANESRLELRVRTQDGDETHIVLRGWESIENLRGQQFDFLVIDEVAMMRDFWLNWQEVLRPTLTDTMGDVMFISTPRGFNHFYDLYNLEREDKHFKSFHFTSYDNPFLPKEELDDAKKQITKDRFAQEYMADFRKAEGLVYKEFVRELHLYSEAPNRNWIQKILAIDFGFTNPTAILDIRIDYDSNIWILSEWYKTGKTNAEIAEYAKGLAPNLVYADPEAPDKINELRLAGLNCRDVRKGKDSVIKGIDQVREYFKQNRIHIHKDCVNLISELETYSYPTEEMGRKILDKNPKELPIKENDHALDALRYFIMMYTAGGERPKVKSANITYNRR